MQSGGSETVVPFLADTYLGWHFVGIADVKQIRPVA
jgi:hypothetical protein